MEQWCSNGEELLRWPMVTQGTPTTPCGRGKCEGQFKSKRSPKMVVLTSGRDGDGSSAKSGGGQEPLVLVMGQTVLSDGGEFPGALFAGSGGSARKGEGWSTRGPLDQSREGEKEPGARHDV
jgi:hypothetical protein